MFLDSTANLKEIKYNQKQKNAIFSGYPKITNIDPKTIKSAKNQLCRRSLIYVGTLIKSKLLDYVSGPRFLANLEMNN